MLDPAVSITTASLSVHAAHCARPLTDRGRLGVVVSRYHAALGGRSAALARDVARAAAEHDAKLCVDVNYRSLLWSAEAARETLAEVLGWASIAVCSERDAAKVFGLDGSAKELARALAANWAPRAELVVITRSIAGSRTWPVPRWSTSQFGRD